MPPQTTVVNVTVNLSRLRSSTWTFPSYYSRPMWTWKTFLIWVMKPVSTHPKCGPMGRKPTVLISLSDTRVYPVATPDATGDLMMTQVFIQSYQFPENASSAKETVPRHHRRGSYIYNRKHGPCDRWDGQVSHFKDFRMYITSNFVDRGKERHL